MTTGKRNLLVKDIPAAVSEFAQACELLSAAFGETGKECAESYFYYGKALLEMSRLESGVLGNALDGVPEEEDEANSSKVQDPAKMTDKEKKEVVEKVGEALKENLIELEKKVEEKETWENDAEAEKDQGEDEGMEEDESQDDKESKEVMEIDVVREAKSVKDDEKRTTRRMKMILLMRKKLLKRIMKKRTTRRMKRKSRPIFNLLGKCLNLQRSSTPKNWKR